MNTNLETKLHCLTSFLKEFMTAYCQDGKIYNCKNKSLCWWHEMGHLERFKNIKLLNLYGHVLLFGTPALFFSKDNPHLFNTIAVFWVFVLFGFEIDAWIYAFKHFNR